MLPLNGGSRIVVSGTELLMIEIEGSVAAGGVLERLRRCQGPPSSDGNVPPRNLARE
jgi:hypothetical protein